MNSDYKIILLNTLFTMYFVFKYEFNIIIPFLSLISFLILKLLNINYNSFEYHNYQIENKIGYEIYEIYENNICYSPLLILIITLLIITNMYELQIILTILLIYVKLQNYDYIRVIDDNYYLVDFKLTRTIICITFLLMCHYSQLLNNDMENMENIYKLIIFVSQNVLYTIDYDINLVD